MQFETGALQPFLESLSTRLNLSAGFSVVLVSDRAIRSYNKRFRHQDRSTDVLSFPHQKQSWESEPYLGDILISVESAQRQKVASLLDELRGLCLHGLLHLCGHDHETDDGAMESLEKEIKKEYGLP